MRMIRVLIVDDHAIFRKGLKELLGSESGLDVCGESECESEAMELVRSIRPDIVIIDISLRRGNGIDLIKRIKAHDKSIRMIVCSMHEDSLYAARALRAGALGYVNKQAPARTIVEAIREVLAGRIFLSSPATERLLRGFSAKKNPSGASPVEALSDRELEVFGLIGQGQTSGQIAKALHVSPRTVETYRRRLKTKLDLKSAAELNRDAVRFWLHSGD
jgi:DNA-binding NarL/FixJ family response regulator